MKKKIYAALAFALYATTFHAQQIYELSGVRSDGSVTTIGMSLENQINELMNKIDNSKPGLEDEIEAAVKKAGI